MVHKAMNAVSRGSENRPKRYLDDNGFLHVFLRFMRTGTLDYSPDTFPDGVPPGAINQDGMVTVLVEPADLKEPDSLASLAGMPGLRRHEWAEPGKKLDQIGSVAGEPYYVEEDGIGYVECEAVITDEETIRLLQIGEDDTSHPDYAKRLKEVSAGYHHEVPWESGEHEGKPYAGKQKKIRYNHFVLLPEGEGRAGPNVKAINSKENEVADKTESGGVSVWSRAYKRLIRVMNADEAKEIAEIDEKAAAENEGEEHEKEEIAEAETRKEIVDQMKEKISALTAERDELNALVAELKESISAGEDADKIEEKADEMATEREEVAEVMNSHGVMDKAQAMNSFKEKKLRGTALKVFAMNSLRQKRGREPISEEQAKNAVAVNAMWDVVKEYAGAPAKKVPVGSPYAAMNSTITPQDARSKALAAIGYTKKGN